MVYEIFQQLALSGRVQRHGDGAEFAQAPDHAEIFDAVWKHDGDMGSLGYTEPRKTSCVAVRQPMGVLVGPGPSPQRSQVLWPIRLALSLSSLPIVLISSG